MGKKKEALQLLRELEAKYKREYMPPFFISLLCFALEKNDKGFQYLEEAYRVKDQWLRYVKVPPIIFDQVRSDPRYKRILRKMGL